MLDQFINYLKNERRYSIHTLNAYQRDVFEFSLFIKDTFEINDLTEISSIQIRDWVVAQMEKGNNPKTIRRKLTAVKMFYRYLLIEEKITENPWKKIVLPKIAKRLPVFVEESKMEMLFSDHDFEHNISGIRDQLILEILYATGMRLSELINLEYNSVQNDRLKVLGKRNKERIIPITPHLSILLQNYLKIRNEYDHHQLPYLLLTDSGNKLYAQFVYRKVNFYLSKVSTSKKKSPHVLRHTFATHLLNKGADLNAVKELLGHANLSATQVYTHNTIEKLKNIYNQAHPLAG